MGAFSDWMEERRKNEKSCNLTSAELQKRRLFQKNGKVWALCLSCRKRYEITEPEKHDPKNAYCRRNPRCTP